MYLFYADIENINEDNNHISLVGEDVNHIKNVLRLTVGEKVTICNGQGVDYLCIIDELNKNSIELEIMTKSNSETELENDIILYQGLPKKDKMELIVQKAVELGAKEIVPVVTKRTVVKLNEKSKEENKINRWNAISMSAAKQSKRGMIPCVSSSIKYDKALDEALIRCNIVLVPYENAKGVAYTKEILADISDKKTIGVFIGPEGGFEDSEIELAIQKGAIPITLGHRILRTETAGLTMLSLIMMACEK